MVLNFDIAGFYVVRKPCQWPTDCLIFELCTPNQDMVSQFVQSTTTASHYGDARLAIFPPHSAGPLLSALRIPTFSIDFKCHSSTITLSRTGCPPWPFDELLRFKHPMLLIFISNHRAPLNCLPSGHPCPTRITYRALAVRCRPLSLSSNSLCVFMCLV